MNGWVNQSMFDGQVFAQLVIDDAISKKSHKVDARLNYATIVSEIKNWQRIMSRKAKASEKLTRLNNLKTIRWNY